MKRRIAIAGSVALLLGCSAATIADEARPSSIIRSESLYAPSALSLVLGATEYMTMLEIEAELERKERLEKVARLEALARNKKIIDDRMQELFRHVNKTRYVFSGSTPNGWDCSGLVVWFYGKVGIELPHSATKQAKTAGTKVEKPKPGDIVVFSYKNSKNYYHAGIYIGDNQIVHSGFKKGDTTEILSLDAAYFNNSNITFIRVIEN